MPTLQDLIQSGDRNAINKFLAQQQITGDSGGVMIGEQPDARLSSLVQQNYAPQEQMQPMRQPMQQPMNTIRTSSGEYLGPSGERSLTPQEFSSQPMQQRRGSPVDVFGQGKGYMQPDGTIVGVNAQGQQFRVQPAGTEAARQAGIDQGLKRQMAQAQIQNLQAEAQARQSGRAATIPAGYRATADGNLEAVPGGPADIKSQMLAQQKGMATEQASITSQQAIDQAAALLNHPGRKAATGASYMLGNIPGTDAKGFASQLETFKAQTFIPMVSALKGMGALSDAEGKKLAASVGALDTSMPEAEFEASLKNVMDTLYRKGRASGLNVANPLGEQSPGTEMPKTGDIQDGHIFLGGNPADPARWRKQ